MSNLFHSFRWPALAASAGLFFQASSWPAEHAPPAWQSGEDFRYLELSAPAGGGASFTLLTPATTGIEWTNTLSIKRLAEYQNLMNGAGVAAGDFDGDGWCDLFLCNKEGPSALYRNLGNWRFEDVTRRAGVGCTNQSSTGATFADVNGDGRLDLLVNSFLGPNACFTNQGEGRFANVTVEAGLTSKGGSTSLALGDVDGDGDLDLYVAYFGIESMLRSGGQISVRMEKGRPTVVGRAAKRFRIVDGKLIALGEPHILYLNDGTGRFAPVRWEDVFRDEEGRPMPVPLDFGLAVQIRDINEDGFPDIYVCNDFQTPDRLWLNDGRGRFQAVEKLARRNMSYAAMGVDFADIDRDGRLDFFVVEMLGREHARRMTQSPSVDPRTKLADSGEDREDFTRNTLYWNRGDGTYAEIANFAGLAATDWSWCTAFVDVDLDGFEDVLVTNGTAEEIAHRDLHRGMSVKQLQFDTPNAAFRNRGDLTFEDASKAWGFNAPNISHGMALADLDLDGDLDVVVNCLNAPPLIYRNESVAPRVIVRLKGRAPNTQGIGAKVTVYGGAVPVQFQEVICGGRYLSGDDPVRVFAAGTRTNDLRIEVVWRSGRKSVLRGVKAGRLYEIDEAGAVVSDRQKAGPRRHDPLFQDVSDRLGHTHHEEQWDDFAGQPLLPRKLSESGPGVAWFDVDGDSHEDLVIGAGKGGALAIYHNDGKGGWAALPALLTREANDDLTGIVGLVWRDGRRSLLAGMACLESGSNNAAAALLFDLGGGGVTNQTPLAASGSSTGPLALADVDGDGDLDLFAGGSSVPRRYPQAADSVLFLQQNGHFYLDGENSHVLAGIGLVSGAVFSDLDGDGWPDLALACEWGPVRVFRNQRGRLRETTRDWGLGEYSGLWTGLTTGDFDGDGRLDIVAGNWGLNSFHQLAPAGPWYLYYGDFNGDGKVHLLEGYLEPRLQSIMPWRDLDLVSRALPWVRERFVAHSEYALATLDRVLGNKQLMAHELKVNTLASMLFLNRGSRFAPLPLPAAAQWSPALGLSVADLDGDGNEDLFLSQNYFAVRPEDNRLDAGRGLLLRGDGQGGLTAVSGPDSGIEVYGQQRSAALCDYDEDGRIDLVVTQNGAQTRLFRNVKGQTGLRIRLQGPPSNPTGVGAQIRLVYPQRLGPVREIHAGSGYWSQDSAVVVMGTATPPTQISVRWPGGKTNTVDAPAGAKEISLSATGEIIVLK